MALYAASAAAFCWKLMKAQYFSGSIRMDWICPNLRGGAAQPAAPGPPRCREGETEQNAAGMPCDGAGLTPGGWEHREQEPSAGTVPDRAVQGGGGAIRSLHRDGDVEDGHCRGLTG